LWQHSACYWLNVYFLSFNSELGTFSVRLWTS